MPPADTARLSFRPMTADDLPALRDILQDPAAMVAYEGAFDETMVRDWFERQQARYAEGLGLHAVVDRASGEMAGQCGLTIQRVGDEEVLEVGYLLRRAFWHRGLATEAASAWVAHGFGSHGADAVHAHVRDTNLASMRVATRLGMTVRTRFVKHYRGVAMPHDDFAVSRADWESRTPRM